MSHDLTFRSLDQTSIKHFLLKLVNLRFQLSFERILFFVFFLCKLEHICGKCWVIKIRCKQRFLFEKIFFHPRWIEITFPSPCSHCSVQKWPHLNFGWYLRWRFPFSSCRHGSGQLLGNFHQVKRWYQRLLGLSRGLKLVLRLVLLGLSRHRLLFLTIFIH